MFQPDVSLMNDAPIIFKVHMLCWMLTGIIFPFTRLVHCLSFPFEYFGRANIIYCQETAGGKGCTVKGVCGKTAEIAELQDDLIYATEVLATVMTQCRIEGIEISDELDRRVAKNLFMSGAPLPAEARVPHGEPNEDVQSLRDLILYGLKGMAAYLYHANQLGYESPEIDRFLQSTPMRTLLGRCRKTP